MKFVPYTDGQERSIVMITQTLSREDCVHVLAASLAGVSELRDQPEQMPKARVEQEIRDALTRDGYNAIERDIDGDEDEWLDWAYAQIERCWP